MGFERLGALLLRHTGQALSLTMQARLGQSLQAQAEALGCDVESYLRRLESPQTPQERAALQSLINLNTVGKTLLWRYPEQLALITEVLLPVLDRRLPPGVPLAVWSAACSTGEEIYSIVLSLALQGALAAGRRPLHLMATDINTDSLDVARSGLLNDLRSRALPPECAAYVHSEGQERYVHESLRGRVHFAQANLMDPATYPSVEGGYHVVICANVLFYFDRARGHQVLHHLAQHMAPDSALLLGGAETLQQTDTPFSLARWRDSFAYVRGDWQAAFDPLALVLPASPVTTLAPAQAQAAAAVSAPAPPAAEPLSVPPAAWDAAAGGDWQACVEVCRRVDLSMADVTADACCRLGLIALKHGYGREAASALTAAVEKDRFTFHSHYYLALACAQEERPHDAIEALRKALFLQPQNLAVRYDFALMLLRTGDTHRAREALERCLAARDAVLDRGPYAHLLVSPLSDAAELRRAVESLLARC